MRRALLVLSVVFAPRPSHACIRASEADKLVGWSADGKYALYTSSNKSGLDHAEILPTSFDGFVYTVTSDEEEIRVAKVKVGTCASFGDDGGDVIEKKKGKLTEKSLMELKTVVAMKFDRAETKATAPKASAAFTGKKRYDQHDVELTLDDKKLVVPLPVYCVGSCLADEDWQKWKITVDGVHTLSSGTTLYELTMPNVCNGGTLHRLITQTDAKIKVPKKRCTGSGE